jgi:three-Cys-motif partner protein
MDEIDPADGLPISEVGEWALEKHERLRKYVDISRAVRKRFTDPNRAPAYRGGATYIEVFSGAGRARVRETGVVIDGSPLVAFKSAADGGFPFTEVHLGDVRSEYSAAAAKRISALGGSAFSYTGSAEETAEQIVQRINPYGLHLAFLDPFNLGGLSYALVKTLARVKHIDLLMHISTQDVQRNTDRYTAEDSDAFDAFAPGWREVVDLNQNIGSIRTSVLDYWQELLRQLKFRDSRWELIRGGRNQRLYWLALASREKIAKRLFEKGLRV